MEGFFIIASGILFCFVLAAFPLIGILAVLLASVLERFYIPIFQYTFSLSDFIALTFVFASLLRLQINPQERRTSPLLIPFSLVALGFSLPVLLSVNPLAASLDCFRLLLYLSITYFLYSHISSKNYFEKIPELIVILFLTTLVAAVIQRLYRVEGLPFRFQAGFSDWNYLPIFIALTIPLLLEYVLHKHSNNKRISLSLLIVAAIVLGVAAKSRSGAAVLIIMLFSIILTCLYPYKRYFYGTLVTMVSILLVGILAVAFSKSLGKDFQVWLAEPRLQERVFNNILMIKAFIQHPLLGVGPGQFESYTYWSGQAPLYPISGSHSSLFVLLAETGLIGTLAWVGLLFTLMDRTFRNKQVKVENGFSLRFLWPLLATLIFSSLLNSIHQHLYTWCLLGILFGLSEQDKNRRESSPRIQAVYKVEKK